MSSVSSLGGEDSQEGWEEGGREITKHIEAVFLDGSKVLCWVYPSLEEDCVYRVFKLDGS